MSLEAARNTFQQQLCEHVQLACEVLSPGANAPVEAQLLMSDEQLREVTDKIAHGIDPVIYHEAYADALPQLLLYLCHEFTLFQAQENIEDPNYALHLMSFVGLINADIRQHLEDLPGDPNGEN